MKREDVKNKIPGITDEQLNWIMQENGADLIELGIPFLIPRQKDL